jgi:hypothetical protein
MERRRGSYERRVTLENQWDTTKTRAEFQDGLLTLRLPRIPQAEGTKRIRLDQVKGATRQTVTTGDAPKEKAALAPEPEKPAAPGNGTGTGSGPLLIGGPINESKS